MSHTEKKVCDAALHAMFKSCEVIKNKNIQHLVPKNAKSFLRWKDVPEIIRFLSNVIFDEPIDFPVLALLVPQLTRGLRSNVPATVSQSVIIFDRMCKRIQDPFIVESFIPVLTSALQQAVLITQKTKSIAQSCIDMLNQWNIVCKETKIDEGHVLNLLKSLVPVDGFDLELRHVAGLCLSLMLIKHFEEEKWVEIQNYWAVVIGKDTSAANIQQLRDECTNLIIQRYQQISKFTLLLLLNFVLD
jgi:elongation factor 3